MKSRGKVLAFLCVVVILAPVLVGFAPWATSLWNYKSRHYSNVVTATSTNQTVDISGAAGTAFTARGMKHISIKNTSYVTDAFINLESARAGQMATTTYSPGALLSAGATADYDFTSSSFDCRVTTGTGSVDLAWQVTQ